MRFLKNIAEMDKFLLAKRLAVAFSAMVVIFLMVSYVTGKVVIAWGESTKYLLFWKIGEHPEKGDYVVVATPKEDKFAKGKVITKQVVCSEGDELKITGLHYYCCSREDSGLKKCVYLGRAKLRSRKGESVKPFNPCGTHHCVVKVPPGKFFVVNHHPDSYDSRYYGFVSFDGPYKILYVVRPLI